MLLSASHVWGLRPRIARLQKKGQRDATAVAGVHKGLATLAARLRLETGVGAAVLLATALMGQTLPPTGTSSAAVAPTGADPAAISGTAVTGDLRVQLTVAPPAVGAATFTLQIWEKGTAITGDTGAAIIHLSPAAQPSPRANLTPTAHGTRFTVRGSLATTGAWRADVLVRTATVNEYRTLPFTFTVGPGATFLAPGLNPAAVTIAVTPGRLSAPNTFTITGVRAPAVRLLSRSLDMNMGIIPYPATPLGGGRWRVGNVYAPMNGRWSLTVQVHNDGAWTTLRQFVYQVPLSGRMYPLTIAGVAHAAASQPTPAPSGSLEVVQTHLCPGTIEVQLRNDGAHPVTIAQVSVNDAFWPFTARPRTTIAPHATASITLRYPWDADVSYEVQFISSTGETYLTDIAPTTTASAPSCP
jgi:hypothetical protein